LHGLEIGRAELDGRVVVVRQRVLPTEADLLHIQSWSKVD
jgi:hypothetical protein